MSVTIITRNTEVAGVAPSSLVQGELAIDVTPDRGKMYYGNNTSGVNVIAQQPYISNSNVPPIAGEPKPGATWWQPDKQALLFSADGVTFLSGAVPPTGGTFTGHIKVEKDGFNYLETSDDADGSDSSGLYTQGMLVSNGGMFTTGVLTVDNDAHIIGQLNVDSNLVLLGSCIFFGAVVRYAQGSFTNYKDGGFSSGQITVSTGGPPGSGMVAGDVHYTIEP